MDLNSLVIFAKVAELSSFSEAARALDIPTSTVSRKLAELESELGVRLIERSTRSFRLTEVGMDILRHAQQSAELSDTVGTIASNHASDVSGILRVSAPPSLSESLIAPLIGAFQASYPEVRVQIFISDRQNISLNEGIDVGLQVGTVKDRSLVARTILTYRHQLVASPAYIEAFGEPRHPDNLHAHRLVAFSFSDPEISWTFRNSNGRSHSVAFQPYLSMNDYVGLLPAILSGRGIGDLPQIVQPELIERGFVVEVMRDWHLPTIHLSTVHAAHRYVPRRVRVFNEFASEMAPVMFPFLCS